MGSEAFHMLCLLFGFLGIVLLGYTLLMIIQFRHQIRASNDGLVKALVQHGELLNTIVERIKIDQMNYFEQQNGKMQNAIDFAFDHLKYEIDVMSKSMVEGMHNALANDVNIVLERLGKGVEEDGARMASVLDEAEHLSKNLNHSLKSLSVTLQEFEKWTSEQLPNFNKIRDELNDDYKLNLKAFENLLAKVS